MENSINEKARSVLRQALLIIMVISLVIEGCGAGISSVLPKWLGGEEVLFKDASMYFLIYACSLPAYGLNALAASMLQCSGNMKTPSILNAMMCLLDVILNAFFIFPGHYIFNIYIPGMNLGVAGAALGTALAELIIAFIMLYFLCVRSKLLHINIKESFMPQLSCQKKAAKISLPVAFEHIVVCGAMIAATRIVAPLGTVAIAANSFAVTAESLYAWLWNC